MEVWSPMWGGPVGPVAGQYEWATVDWSDFLQRGDEHGLTGIRFRASRGNVAMNAVEVCLQE
jgi:hypothetical protein